MKTMKSKICLYVVLVCFGGCQSIGSINDNSYVQLSGKKELEEVLKRSGKNYKCRNINFENRYAIEIICKVKKDNSEVLKILTSDINDEMSDYGDTALKTAGAAGVAAGAAAKDIVMHVPYAIIESILTGVYEGFWESL